MNVYILQVMSILRQGYCSPKYLYYLLPAKRRLSVIQMGLGARKFSSAILQSSKHIGPLQSMLSKVPLAFCAIRKSMARSARPFFLMFRYCPFSLRCEPMRRPIATLAQKKGTVKDVQGVLRHSRTATTTDVYMQEIPESVQATVNSINEELRKSSVEKTSRTTQKRAPVTADFIGRRSKKRVASESVLQNLTPNDTNLERREVVSC